MDKIAQEALRRTMWNQNQTNNEVTRYIADAVAEKSVRDEGCEVCNENECLRVWEGTFLIWRSLRDLKDAKFCPICGRKLEDRNEF